MMMTYLGNDLGDVHTGVRSHQGCHAIFQMLKRLYAQQLHAEENAVGDDEHVI